MKNLILLLFVFTFLFSCNHDKKEKMKNHQNHEKSKKMLRHAVLFKFKDGTKPEEIKKVEEAFRALPSKIKEIQGFEFGTNNSPENLNQGFTHMFFLTFKSESDRAIYLPHPDHKAFGAVLTPYLDKVLVLDYWTEN